MGLNLKHVSKRGPRGGGGWGGAGGGGGGGGGGWMVRYITPTPSEQTVE